MQSAIPRSSPTTKKVDVTNLGVFALAALSFVYAHILGQLYLVDIVLLVITIFTGLTYSRTHNVEIPEIRKSLWLLGLWLLGAVVSDLVHNSPFQDWSRGWLRIAFTVTNLFGLAVIIANKRDRLISAFLGYVIAGVAQFLVQPNIFAQTNPWKFGVAYPMTFLLALLVSHRKIAKRRFMPTLLLITLGAAHVALNARSLGALTILTGLILLLKNRSEKPRPSKAAAASIALVVMSGAVLMASVYGSLASSGELGDEALQKYEYQGQGKYGPALGGRYEIIYSSAAIVDSPLIGHGSFPILTREADGQARRQLAGMGYRILPRNDDQKYVIPTHSHLFQAWVEAGVLGIFFWVYAFRTCCKSILRETASPSSLSVLRLLSSIMLIWDILFSPYGADRRFSVPLILILLSMEARKQRNESKRTDDQSESSRLFAGGDQIGPHAKLLRS